MIQDYGLEQLHRSTDSVITVGTFDGVHRGHQSILQYVIERARTLRGQSVVLTFDPHPREVLRGEPVPLLTTINERAEILEELGLDRFVVLPFTRAFSNLSPREYVKQILVKGIGVQKMVVGYDHTFGKGGEGDSQLLQELGEEFGFSVDVIPAQVIEQSVISSTAVREAIMNDGDVRHARELLGRTYTVTGTVVKGDQRGRSIGFPTANIEVADPRKIIPRDGVYAVRVTRRGVDEALEAHPGMMNIGWRPTFGGENHVLEVHLLDFDSDLYGEQLQVAFVDRIREEKTFDGLEALVAQLRSDRAAVADMLSDGSSS